MKFNNPEQGYAATGLFIVHLIYLFFFILFKTDFFTNTWRLGSLPGNYEELFNMFLAGPCSAINVDASWGENLFLLCWYLWMSAAWFFFWLKPGIGRGILMFIPFGLWIALNLVFLTHPDCYA